MRGLITSQNSAIKFGDLLGGGEAIYREFGNARSRSIDTGRGTTRRVMTLTKYGS